MTAPSPAGGRGKAWRILEHGTRIYRPTDAKRFFRIVFLDERGGRIERTAVFEAEALEIAKRAESYLGAHVSQREGRTVADLVGSYLVHLETKGRDDRYLERQESHCRTWILPAIGDLALSDWTAYESDLVLAAVSKAGRGPDTYQGVGSTMRGLVTHAHTRRWLPRSEDPMEGVEYSVKSEEEGESADFVTPDQIPGREDAERLAKALETLFEPYWGLACRVAAQGAPRWGELIALRPMDTGLPPGKRTVNVVSAICEPGKDRKTGVKKPMYRKQTKSRRRRQTIYYRSLADPIAERVAEVEATDGPEGLLFPGPDGRFVSRFWFRQHRLLPAMHEAGWEFVRPRTPRHNWRSLRHLAATTMLFDLGFEISLVSLMLGHTNTAFTFRKYIGNRGDAIGRAHDATEDV